MNVRTHLNALESAGLVQVARLEPDLEYLFRHALVQEAVYTSLLSTDRKRLHKSVGESIEQIYGDRLDDLAAVLARHFKEAGEDDRAYQYFILAGDAALESYANREAETQYRNALSLACGEREHARLLHGLGEALYRQSRFYEAIAVWGEGIDLFQTLDDVDEVARLYARSARAAWYASDPAEGLRLALEGLGVVGDALESPAMAMLIHEAARAYHFNGLPEKALPLCKQALEMAERLGAIDVQADTLSTLGVLPNMSPEQSGEALRKAVDLSEAAGLLQTATRAHHNLAVLYSYTIGDFQLAREHYQRSAEIARQRGVVTEEAYSIFSLTAIYFTRGDLSKFEELIAHIEELLPLMDESDISHLSIRSMRALLSWMHGELDNALKAMRISLEDARQRSDLQALLYRCTDLAWATSEYNHWEGDLGWSEVESLYAEAIGISDRGLGDKVEPRCSLIAVLSRQGKIDAARQLLSEAEQIAAAEPAVWHESDLAMAGAELARAEGRLDAALAHAEKLAAVNAQLGRRLIWARSLLGWAQIHAQRGEPTDLERARALLREARRAYEQIGASYYVAVIEKLLEALRTRIYAQAQDHLKVSREMADAGRVQESLLPDVLPELPGWDLAVTLEPAGRTSGDFYDFIPLPGDRLGIVVADVADKGAGAALFMALTRSLLRTYAAQHADQPHLAITATNQRILADSHAGLFVTIFYAVLDPANGELAYCNAGHNPPFLLEDAGGESLLTLKRTGVPLGIFESASWESQRLQLQPGDILALYTDGVTEAQSPQEEFYGEGRLQAVLLAQRDQPVEGIQKAVLQDVHAFIGDSPRFDDLTLMVLRRDRPEGSGPPG